MGRRADHRKRLQIHRETLRTLNSAALGEVGGGVTMDVSDSGVTQPKSNLWTGKIAAGLCLVGG